MKESSQKILVVGFLSQVGSALPQLLTPLIEEGSQLSDGLTALRQQTQSADVAHGAAQLLSLLKVLDENFSHVHGLLEGLKADIDKVTVALSQNEETNALYASIYQRLNALNDPQLLSGWRSFAFEWSKLIGVIEDSRFRGDFEKLLDSYGLEYHVGQVNGYCTVVNDILQRLSDALGTEEPSS